MDEAAKLVRYVIEQFEQRKAEGHDDTDGVWVLGQVSDSYTGTEALECYYDPDAADGDEALKSGDDIGFLTFTGEIYEADLFDLKVREAHWVSLLKAWRAKQQANYEQSGHVLVAAERLRQQGMNMSVGEDIDAELLIPVKYSAGRPIMEQLLEMPINSYMLLTTEQQAKSSQYYYNICYKLKLLGQYVITHKRYDGKRAFQKFSSAESAGKVRYKERTDNPDTPARQKGRKKKYTFFDDMPVNKAVRLDTLDNPWSAVTTMYRYNKTTDKHFVVRVRDGMRYIVRVK